MAARNELAPLKKSSNFRNIGENNKYSNVNLNQNHKCLNESFVHSNSKSICNNKGHDCSNIKKTDLKIVDGEKRSLSSWNKSSLNELHSKSYNSISTFNEVEENIPAKWKNDSSNATSSSTLSLHIAAYENSFEGSDTVSLDKKDGLKKDLINEQALINSALNPCVFPRQQTYDAIKPEMMQFTASQQLFIPNQFTMGYKSFKPFFFQIFQINPNLDGWQQKTFCQFQREKTVKNTEKFVKLAKGFQIWFWQKVFCCQPSKFGLIWKIWFETFVTHCNSSNSTQNAAGVRPALAHFNQRFPHSRARNNVFARTSLPKKNSKPKKPHKILCHNCKEKHIVEKCLWDRCMFCWFPLKGQHHRCHRLWVKQLFPSVGEYRKKMNKLAKKHSLSRLEKDYDKYRKEYNDIKKKKCVKCGKIPNHLELCKYCKVELECAECLEKEPCCEGCRFKSNVFNELAHGSKHNVHQGTLHVLVRHYREFKNKISSTKELSSKMINLMDECSLESKPSYQNIESYFKDPSSDKDKEVLNELEESLFLYIQKKMTMKRLMRTEVNDSGAMSFDFRVHRDVLRVVVAKELYLVKDESQNETKEVYQVVIAFFRQN